MKTAIIGMGFVGTAMYKLFPDAILYDKNIPYHLAYISPLDGKEVTRPITIADVNTADVAFVCVPTPNLGHGALDTSTVEEVVAECTCPLIIIRSTLQPGTADRLSALGKNIVVMPEYIGETIAHPLLDEQARPFMILGGTPENRRKAIEVFQSVYSAGITIRQVTALEAEIIKLSENRAIMYKVAQCQELFDACEAARVDYYTVREAVYGDDPRFTLWFTFVYPDKRGANSKCIPKDVYAWSAWAESVGMKPNLTNQMLSYNETLLAPAA